MLGKDLRRANRGHNIMRKGATILKVQGLWLWARLWTGLWLALMLLGGCADYLPTASGELSGTVAAPPPSWTEVAKQEIIQLETQPTDPYSVNLWVIGDDDRLYVFAGDNYTTWIEHIDADPNVRLKTGGSIYLLRATRVTDAEEFEWFAQAWDAKYGHRPRNENVAETYLMRLSPRSS